MEPLLHLRENQRNIEELIGYCFAKSKFFEEAFIHKSYFYENATLVFGYNERLEFLGDAVLQLLMSEHLYEQYPEKDEGELSQYRSRLVDAQALSRYTETMGIGDFLVLSKGERKQEKKNSLLANLFEALLGAVYLDGGLVAARTFLFNHIQNAVHEVMNSSSKNAKSAFQEWAQKMYQAVPDYVVVEESGPDHRRFFRVEVRVQEIVMGMGEGFSKKEAERKAAEEALLRIV